MSAVILFFRTLFALLRSRSTPRTWCLLRCCHAEAYLGASISVPCATDRLIGLSEFYVTHLSVSDGPRCKIQEAQLLLCSSRRSETYGTEEIGHQRSFAVRGLVLYNSSAWSTNLLSAFCPFEKNTLETLFKAVGDFKFICNFRYEKVMLALTDWCIN